jgi:hypothetical protein
MVTYTETLLIRAALLVLAVGVVLIAMLEV